MGTFLSNYARIIHTKRLRPSLVSYSAFLEGEPFQNPLSVRNVLTRDDPLRRYPHQQLTLHRVATAVLIGPVGTHVAAPDASRPVKEVGIPGGQFGGALDHDEVEGRFFLVDA